jgi:outer membrane translocation and assembly module TamA
MMRMHVQLTRLVAMLWLAWPAAALAQVDDTEPTPLVVQEVTCSGNRGYSCDFIREHLYLRPGAMLDEEEVRNAELRLSALRTFKSVHIRLEKGARRGDVVVVIEVDEANPVSMEWGLGANLQEDAQIANLVGRVTHHNLFGQGKIGEVRAHAFAPVARDGGTAEGYHLALTYADPQLFGSSRYFGFASAGFSNHLHEDSEGNYSDFKAAQLNVAVGRRFGDFSYVMLELNHRPSSDWSYGWWNNDPVFEMREFHGRGTKATLIYGWSSEDDHFFPTQGSALQFAVRRDFGANAPDRYAFVRYRKTWEAMDGYLSFKIGGEPTSHYRTSTGPGQLLSLNYSRPLTPGDSIERGRWYVEPGISGISISSSGETRVGYGIKAGWRAETRRFGLIDLYVIGFAESVR